MNQVRYTDVPMEIAQRVFQLCTEKEKHPVLLTRKSNHPEDMHLYLLLAESRRNLASPTYIVWTYNAATHSFQHGAYDLSLPHALQNMAERTWNAFAAQERGDA